MFPETGEEEHFQKVSKRISLETCEKTDVTSDGLRRAEGTQRNSRQLPENLEQTAVSIHEPRI